ncbi:MAG TPA: AMP-binding protein [Pseudonocardia sp.]
MSIAEPPQAGAAELSRADGGPMPVEPGSRHVTTVVAAFWDAVRDVPDRTALDDGRRRLSYRQYGRAVAALADRLAVHGVAGRRVLVALPNGIECAVATFAALSAGAQVAFVNPAYPEPELTPQIRAAAPVVAVTGASAAVPSAVATAHGVPVVVLGPEAVEDLLACAPVAPPRAPAPEAAATLMFTGGTTGVAKAVPRDHRALLLTVQGMEACWPTTRGAETWLNVAPMFHIWGALMGLFNPAYRAATLVVVPRFEPGAVVAALSAHRVTVFGGGPAAIYAALLAAPTLPDADLSALRVCPGGGSSFAEGLLERWERRTGVPVHEAFGMTELAPISCNPPGRPPRPGTVGTPAPLVSVRVADLDDPAQTLPVGEIGEVLVAGPHALKGYLDAPEESAATVVEGWVRTGDIGRMDAEGNLTIVDRKKDMLLVGGFNVYPREIDEALARHPGVAESATIGVPDERKGERPLSFVVPVGDALLDPALLRAHCTASLVGYKQPVEIVVVPALPRTAANKIDRRALRAGWRRAPDPQETGVSGV